MLVVKGNVEQVLRKQEYQLWDSRTIDKTRNEQRKEGHSVYIGVLTLNLSKKQSTGDPC